MSYYCDDCEDTGAILMHCAPAHRCNGFSTRTDGPKQTMGAYQRGCATHATYEHEYILACHCEKGRRFRPQEPNSENAENRAAKL